MQRDESLFNAKAQRAAKIRKGNLLWQSISFNRLSNDEVIHPIFFANLGVSLPLCVENVSI